MPETQRLAWSQLPRQRPILCAGFEDRPGLACPDRKERAARRMQALEYSGLTRDASRLVPPQMSKNVRTVASSSKTCLILFWHHLPCPQSTKWKLSACWGVSKL